MFAMSLASITLVVWRFLLNRAADTDLNAFLPAFQERLAKDGVDGALRYCREAPGVIPKKLYVAGLETARFGSAAMRRAMANVIELEILPALNFLLPLILAIAKVATMVGLLGTVISMIGTFTTIEEVARSKSGEVAGQAGSIGLALFATALGLIIAIPPSSPTSSSRRGSSPSTSSSRTPPRKLLTLMQATKASPAAGRRPAAAVGKSGEVSSVTARK